MALISGNVSLQNSYSNCCEAVGFWIHRHPTTVKVIEVAGVILGAGLILAVPFSAPIIGMVGVVSLALTGIVLVVAGGVALYALDYLIPPHHDMKNHAYTPGECEGGKLYYEGDVPILSLNSDDPFKAGKAHGYLCGSAINQVTKRFHFAFHSFLGQPRAEALPRTLAVVRQTIPPEYIKELEGVVEGYNKWAEENWWRFPTKLTVDDALLLHLMPDSLHFHPDYFEENLIETQSSAGQQRSVVACSAIIDRDAQRGLSVARNMDWLSCGIAGKYSLVIHRKHANGLRNTVEVGVPGFVGTFTGMNDQGLSLAMNVCAGTTENPSQGMPAAFYNRACLERCYSVVDAERFIRFYKPLGPYHLTLADKHGGRSVHLYQSPQKTHVVRPWVAGYPLATFNYRYTPAPDRDMHCSSQRQKEIEKFFQQRQNRPLEDALSLPFINNWSTTHRVIMEPQTGTIKVAFDNAFAGSAPLHALSTQKLFV